MIDLDLSLILTVAVLFLLLLSIVNKSLLKPLVKHIDDRNESVKNGLAKASENTQEIAKLKEEAIQIINIAKKEASNSRSEKLGAAKDKLAKQIEAKKADIEAELNEFYSKLSSEQEALKSTLLGQAPLFKESLKAKLISNG
jgi:F-type H+-transporting ATPase subunit b